MPYFTSRLLSRDGQFLAETDFTLRELIPMVRHLTRRMGAMPEIGNKLSGYRAVITPQFAGSPRLKMHFGLPEEWADSREQNIVSEVVQLLEREVEALTATYNQELAAFYEPGTSSLCSHCPERSRCPGGGVVESFDPRGWLVFGSTTSSAEGPMRFLTLSIETANRQTFFEHDYPLSSLQGYLTLVGHLLQEEGRIPVETANYRYSEILYRAEGEPRPDLLLSTENLARAWRKKFGESAAKAPEPTYQLVDWDRLEATSSATAENPVSEIPIRVLASDSEPLAVRLSPASGRLERAGTLEEGSEPVIYLHRKVWQQLMTTRTKVQAEVGGVLVGEPFTRQGDSRMAIEIVAALPAMDARGEQRRFSLDHQLLRNVQEHVNRDYPEHRTVGWYSYHLLGQERVVLFSADRDFLTSLGERLFLSEEERFLHERFFPQPWQVGLIIDALADGMRFYFHDQQKAASASGFYLVD